jgi:hypothetical protein
LTACRLFLPCVRVKQDFHGLGNRCAEGTVIETGVTESSRDPPFHGLDSNVENRTTYLQRQRVAAACRALLEGDRRILDVALDAGFDSSSAFHANFRSATGLAPGDYRRLVSDREFVFELPRGYRSAEIIPRPEFWFRPSLEERKMLRN